jgi:hypothetical protein
MLDMHKLEKQTLHRLQMVHFSESQTDEVTMERWEWPNLEASVANTEYWSLSEVSSISQKYDRRYIHSNHSSSQGLATFCLH